MGISLDDFTQEKFFNFFRPKTLPKLKLTASLPLKIGRNPKRTFRLPTIDFQGQKSEFQGVQVLCGIYCWIYCCCWITCCGPSWSGMVIFRDFNPKIVHCLDWLHVMTPDPSTGPILGGGHYIPGFDRICPSTSVGGSYHPFAHLKLFRFQVFAQQKLRHKKDLSIFDPYVWSPKNPWVFSCPLKTWYGNIQSNFLKHPPKRLFLPHRFWKHDSMYIVFFIFCNPKRR